MDPRFAAAEDAFKANSIDDGVRLLSEAITDAGDAAPVTAYRRLTAILFNNGRHEEARKWCEQGLKRYRKDFDLWNVLGVANRRLLNYPEALAALDQAQKLNPKSDAPIINKTNVYNDTGKGAQALEGALKLVRKSPNNAEFHRMAATAYRHLHDWDKARARLETAVRLQPSLMTAWVDLISISTGLQQHDRALDVVDRALVAIPDSPRLLESKAIVMRRAGKGVETQQFLLAVIAKDDTAAWAHHQLARTIADDDRPRANVHFRRALELQPSNLMYRISLVQTLDRTRTGDEGANIQEAYEVLLEFDQYGNIPNDQNFVARSVFHRVGDYGRTDRFGTFAEIGREWARANNHSAFLGHLARVETPEDRYELLEQHRMWGKSIEAHAANNPVVRPPRRPANGKIRLGIISSDLRNHPVGYFALPLFDFTEPDRFELYCYSFSRGAEDNTQKYFTSKADVFRWEPQISDRDAAQMIANDDVDMLIELGGSTHMNKIDVMAYRPGRINASWLGYPHSVGLETIDYIVVDPYMKPDDPKLLIEKPMIMPHTWLALGRGQFREKPEVDPTTPEERNGFITYGTANNPHKYGPEMLKTWARVVAETPNSQFLFVRPEGGTAAFRENMQAIFASQGVAPERVRFQAIRGAHLPFYNELDITLDTFPLTGGTTTCETLWMGVPVVSLIGQALFERLSYSILSNAGLGDLAVHTLDDYVATAVKLAGDSARRKTLRATLREQIKASPLGRTDLFAKDFYNLVAATVSAAR